MAAPPPPDSPPALVMATAEAYQRRNSYQSPAYPERSNYYNSNEPVRPANAPSRQNSYDTYSAPHRDNHVSRPPLPLSQPAQYSAPESSARSTPYNDPYASSTSFARDAYTPPKPYAPVHKTNYDSETRRSPSYGSGPISRLVDPSKEYDSYAASEREAYNGHGGVEPYHGTSYHRPMQYVNA